MRNWRGGGKVGTLFLVLLMLGGCNRQDTERLGRIGKIAAHRVELVLGDVGDDLLARWQQGQERRHKSQLAREISKRLENDKDLANCKIEVLVEGDQVELRGVVKDRQQRQ